MIFEERNFLKQAFFGGNPFEKGLSPEPLS